MKLYENHFERNKIFRSTENYQKTLTNLSALQSSRNCSSKSPIFTNILKKQTTIHTNPKILNLPKSPFGIHNNYNTQLSNFQSQNFFPSKTKKKQNFLKREIKSASKLGKTKKKNYLKALQDFDVYKHEAGELVCKTEKNAIKKYIAKFDENTNATRERIQKLIEKVSEKQMKFLNKSNGNTRLTRFPTPLL